MAPPAHVLLYTSIRRRARETIDASFGKDKDRKGLEARLLLTQAARAGLAELLMIDCPRMLLHNDPDTALRKITILLAQRLPQDTPARAQQRAADRAEFDQLARA